MVWVGRGGAKEIKGCMLVWCKPKAWQECMRMDECFCCQRRCESAQEFAGFECIALAHVSHACSITHFHLTSKC
jgi:hypothetical protein